MRRRSLVLGLAATSLLALPALAGSAAADPPELAPGTHPGSSNHVVYNNAKGHAKSGGARPSRAVMTNHGGPIMTSSSTKAIFWGTSWGTYVGDKITGLEAGGHRRTRG